MLSNKEIKKYNRHIIMPEIGLSGQTKLKQAKVLVVGAGGLGSPVLLYLSAAGIGRIGIIEFDTVSETNLHRQIMYSANDIGKLKSEVAHKKLLEQNPETVFDVYDLILAKANAISIIKKYDLVVDCSDNFATRFLINDACVILNKPFVFGALYMFEGQVSVFNYKNGATYRCLFPEAPNDDDVPNCSQVGVLSTVAGIIGTIQANEAIKIILEIGEVLSGKLFIFNVLNFETNIINFPKSDIKITELQNYEDICKYKDLKVNEIDPFELNIIIRNNDNFQLIDLRSVEDYQLFNLGGLNVWFKDFYENIDLISKTQKVIICCRTGINSETIVTNLQQNMNYNNVYSLFGGINTYKAIFNEELRVKS